MSNNFLVVLSYRITLKTTYHHNISFYGVIGWWSVVHVWFHIFEADDSWRRWNEDVLCSLKYFI